MSLPKEVLVSIAAFFLFGKFLFSLCLGFGMEREGKESSGKMKEERGKLFIAYFVNGSKFSEGLGFISHTVCQMEY